MNPALILSLALLGADPPPPVVSSGSPAVPPGAGAGGPGLAAAPEQDRAEVHGRIDLSHTLSADNETVLNYSYTDLRVALDGTRLTGAGLSFRVDGRGRYSWTGLADHRLMLTDAWIRKGDAESAWRFTLGRQTVRAVGSAQVDGLAVEHSLSPRIRAVAFAGLMPHPVTSVPTLDFTTAGAGYELLAPGVQHGGGLAVSLFRFGLDRIYLTERATVVFSPALVLTAFAIADLAQPQGLVPLSGTTGLDLTSALLLLRLRPSSMLDISLSASHQHTILPSLWWAEWINEELRRRGFVIDGQEPVGTRITSTRLTLNVPVTRSVVPFVRARFDVRHTETATGFEALAGVKVRPGRLFVLAQGGYRRYFDAKSPTAGLEGGYEGEGGGGQVGATGLLRSTLSGANPHAVLEVHGMLWLELAPFAPPLKGVILSGQYQGLLDSGFLYHAGFVQFGYRLS